MLVSANLALALAHVKFICNTTSRFVLLCCFLLFLKYHLHIVQLRPCSHLVPKHWCPSTGTKCGHVQTLGAQNVRMFTFNKPSTCSLYSNRGDRNMYAFRVRYCCLIISFYGFFTFLMLCLYMKHASDDMGYDHLCLDLLCRAFDGIILFKEALN